MTEFSHIDKSGNPLMVNVSNKLATHRMATARGVVVMPEQTLRQLLASNMESKKGPVFQTAIVAGIMAAKKTGDLIPLCHPLGLENCHIEISVISEVEIVIQCNTEIEAKTGVEMEALIGVTIAALTIYDMCKALSHNIVIKEISLVQKSGGREKTDKA